MNLQMEKYLKPTFVIDCNNPAIQGKGKDLTEGQEDIITRAQSLFYFVRDEIRYNSMYQNLALSILRQVTLYLERRGIAFRKRFFSLL